MSFFTSNLRALAAHAPEAAAALSQASTAASDGEPLLVENAISGDPTARYGGVLLHSSRDPRNEARRGVSALCRRSPPIIVVHGLSLAYQVEEILAGTSDSIVIVIEPSITITRALIEVRDVAALFSDPRLHILISPDLSRLDTILRGKIDREFVVYRLPNRQARDLEFWQALDRSEARLTNRLSINRHTVSRFGARWIANLLSNLDQLSRSVGVSNLAGALSDLPVLLVAAGPTLDRYLPALPALARRMAVIAVDTAVAPCLRFGVEPDLVVVVDPQYWNSRHLDRTRGASLLVAEPATYPVVFRHFASPAVLCSSLFPLGRIVEEAIGEFGALGAGGSVATSAWDLARISGAPRVVAAGLDLGFPDKRTHCRGSFFEEYSFSAAVRQSPAETTFHRYRESGNPYLLRSEDGASVQTDQRMEVYRGWFSDQLCAPGAPETQRLGRTGAPVEGLRSVELSTLLSLPERPAGVRNNLLGRLSAHPERTGHLIRALERLADQLAELESLAEAAIGVLERVDLSAESVDLSELASIDELIAQAASRDVVSFLLQEEIHQITHGFGARDINEQLLASTELYTGIAKSAAFQRARIAGALERYSRRFGAQANAPTHRHSP